MAGEGDERDRLATTLTMTDAPAVAGVDPQLPLAADGDYELLGEVARGGAGRILRARDRRLRREVALKQPHNLDAARARFVREALLTARLQHPAIIPVHEVGQFPSGEPFIAMKLVRGRSLRDEIKLRPTLEERMELLPNVAAVADAIAYAHSQRVIHRDLKPANVLLGDFGETVVIDWGLAKDLDSPDRDATTGDLAAVESVDATVSGAVLGTPAYMAPEQAAGDEADARVDVYALGALLYHVLAGAAPFEGRDTIAVLREVRSVGPPRLAQRVPGVPPDLVAVVEKAMQRDRAQRYRDAREFAADLHRFQLGQLPTTRDTGEQHDPALEPELELELRRKTLRPLRVYCAIAVVLVPAFAILELLGFHRAVPSLVIARGLTTALVGAMWIASYYPWGERYSHELILAVVLILGEFLVILNQLHHGQMQYALMPSLLLVLLGCSTMFRMKRGKFVAVLVIVAASHIGVAIVTGRSLLVIFGETMLLGSAILIATLGVDLNVRLHRSEFYSRRRLEVANARLMQLERSAGGH